MYIYESTGVGNLKFGIIPADNIWNGYAIGKRWAEVTVRMWKEDIRAGLLFIEELYNDGRFPAWWLDEVLKRK